MLKHYYIYKDGFVIGEVNAHSREEVIEHALILLEVEVTDEPRA